MKLLALLVLLVGLSCAHQPESCHVSKLNWHLDIDRSTHPPTLEGYCLEYYWRDGVALDPREWVCYEFVKNNLNKGEEPTSN